MSKSEHVGVNWPPAAQGKTTQPAKEVWAAVAAAGGDNALAEKILGEKDWRYGYVPHCSAVADLVAKKSGKIAAQAGMDKLKSTFVLIDKEKGLDLPLSEVNKIAPKKGGEAFFSAKIVEGTGEQRDAGVPYRGKVLSGNAFASQCDDWLQTGRIEKDTSAKLKEAINAVGQLKGKVFVLLGAGSEMGPMEFLLEHGATVLAVRTRKPQAWVEMAAFAEKTTGKLVIPVDKDGAAGCDICAQPLEIRDFVLNNLPEKCTDLTVGMYTYLDSEAHVRVSLGCDLIMEGISQYVPAGCVVRRAYLGSPSVSTAISREMCEASDANRANAGFFTKMCMAPQPRLTRGIEGNEDACIWHGYSTLQGPNYALAKCLQTWAAMNHNGPVSFANGPFTYTTSVTHNATAKTILDAIHMLEPSEAFQPDTARSVLGLLLTYDTVVAKDEFPYHGDFARVTQGGCFHGGVLRIGFDYESSKLLGARLLMKGKIGI